MEEYWKTSLVIFAIFSVFTVSTVFAHNLIKGEGILLDLISALFFFLSLTVLWPYLVAILITESPVVWLGINWNNWIMTFGVIGNIAFIYILSCALIVLYNWVKK